MRFIIHVLFVFAFLARSAASLPVNFGTWPVVSDGGPGNPSRLPNPVFYSYSNPIFKYWFPVTTNGSEIGGGALDATNTFAPLQVSFQITGASNFEWESMNSAYGGYQVQANDGLTNYYSTVSPYAALYPADTPSLYLVTLPYQTNWNITLLLAEDDGYYGQMYGVNAPAGSTLRVNTFAHQRILVVLGDSYVKGYVPDELDPDGGLYQDQWLNGFAWDLQRYGDNVKVYPAGVGGQGYARADNSPPYYVDRVTNDVLNIGAPPDFLLVTGSINDNTESSNSVYQAATNLYATLISNLPSTKIAVIGNWYVGPSIYATDIAQDEALQAAAQQYGLPYASPVQGAWGPGGVGSDSVHPTVEVYSNYAADIETNLAAWWGTNWTDAAVQPQIWLTEGDPGAPTNAFAFDVAGLSNQTVVLDACSNLSFPDWEPIQTNVLHGGPVFFYDPQWTNYSSRFYRITVIQ